MHARAVVPVLSIVAAAVAACSAATTEGHGKLLKSAVPARAYDAIVYLCPESVFGTEPCPARATDAEVAALRDELSADPGVGALAYLSPEKAVELYVIEDKPGAYLVEPGDLPASFLVTLLGSVGVSDLTDHYASAPGVDSVRSCATADICLVSELRRVHVIP